jgi:hypothetical protein
LSKKASFFGLGKPIQGVTLLVFLLVSTAHGRQCSCDEVSVDVIQLPLPEIDENQSRIVSS